MAGTMVQVATTCTTINEQKTYAELPPETKGYLQEKIEFALKVPDFANVQLPDGSNTIAMLKQIAMSWAIRLDEAIADFYWQYKAEVCFDMTPARRSQGAEAPIPFLSSHVEDGPGRRHSLNPFPRAKGGKPGMVRRPDVIIVINPDDRWPGRSLIDHEGKDHDDNSLRLVEIKFPGDDWGEGQERDYQWIAAPPGLYKERMTVIDVSDCHGDLEEAHARVRAMSGAEREAEMSRRREERRKRLRLAIRSVEAIPEPAWYETWLRQAEAEGEVAVAAVWDTLNAGAQYLSAEMQGWLRQHAPWSLTAGQWVQETAGAAWCYVDAKGQEVYRYTAAQLKAGWQAIVRSTDMTWELFGQINWTQVGTSIVKGLVALIAVVAGVVVIVVLSEVLLAVLLALAAILATASAAAVAVLAAVLGVSEMAAA